MHKLRSDARFIKVLYIATPSYNWEAVQVFQELPLVVVDPKQAYLADQTANKLTDKQVLWERVKNAREGMYMITTRAYDTDEPVIFYFRLYNKDEFITFDTFSEVAVDKGGRRMFGYITSFIMDENATVTTAADGTYRLSFRAGVSMSLCTPSHAVEVEKKLTTPGAKKTLPQMLTTLLDLIGGLFLWLESDQSIRPVAVRNVSANKTEKKHKKPWLREDLTEVRFLNELPKPAAQPRVDRGGTHASPKKHFRQAGRRTLQHPRYRNHPLYKVEGAIPFRSTWVGVEQSVVVNGTEYKVWSL